MEFEVKFLRLQRPTLCRATWQRPLRALPDLVPADAERAARITRVFAEGTRQQPDAEVGRREREVRSRAVSPVGWAGRDGKERIGGEDGERVCVCVRLHVCKTNYIPNFENDPHVYCPFSQGDRSRRNGALREPVEDRGRRHVHSWGQGGVEGKATGKIR